MQEAQRGVFHNRLKRISKGGSNTMAQVYVGPGDAAAVDEETWDQPSLLSEILMVPFGFLIGAMSMIAGRLAHFHLFTKANAPYADYANLTTMLYAEIFVGMIFALALARMFMVERGMRFLALFLGFFLALWGQEFLIAAYPEVFVLAFSETHVIESLGLSATGA
jgi:hypothetical protein